MKSEYVRLAHMLDRRTLALAVKIADSCATSDLESNLPWVGPDDEGVAGEVPRGEHWYDTADPEAKEEEWLADALAYLDARKLLLRKEGAAHLVRIRQEPQQPPYPFCEHAEKCIAAGRCERTVKGEPWSCAD